MHKTLRLPVLAMGGFGPPSCAWVVKLGPAGAVQWQQVFPGANDATGGVADVAVVDHRIRADHHVIVDDQADGEPRPRSAKRS